MTPPHTPHTPSLASDVQQRLDAHLDAVDQILRRYDQSRSERAAITDELDNQIMEMLAQHMGENSEDPERQPTLDDLETVLKRIDPPEAYARHSIDLPAEPTPLPIAEVESRFNRATIFGFVWIGWFVLAFILMFVGMFSIQTSTISMAVQPQTPGFHEPVYPVATNTHAAPRMGIILAVVIATSGLLAPIATTGLGIMGISQIRHSRGRQHGLGLATFDALFFPGLIVIPLISIAIGALFYLGVDVIRWFSGTPNMFAGNFPNNGSFTVPFAICQAIAVPFALYIAWRIIRLIWRHICLPVD